MAQQLVAILLVCAVISTVWLSGFGVFAALETDVSPQNRVYQPYGPAGTFSKLVALQITDDTPGAIPLANAQFEIYRVGTGPAGADERMEEFVYDNTEKLYWHTPLDPSASAALASGADGFVYVRGLPDGVYYFLQTGAPNGYLLPSGSGATTPFTVDTAVPIGVGTPEIADTKGAVRPFDSSTEYMMKPGVSTTGGWAFKLVPKDGYQAGISYEFDVACAHLGIEAPPQSTPLPSANSQNRDNTWSAFAHALAREALSGMTHAEWKMFWAFPESFHPPITHGSIDSIRAGYMQTFIWLKEIQVFYPTVNLWNPGVYGSGAWRDPYGIDSSYPGYGTGTSGVNVGFNLGHRLTGNSGSLTSYVHFPDWIRYYHMLALFDEIMTQYGNGKTTGLVLSFDESTNVFTFNHDGYVPHGTGGYASYVGVGTVGEEVYDTVLIWPATAGLSVVVNGGSPVTSPPTGGLPVKKTDLIELQYNGTGEVEFTLLDRQHYLSAGSVKGTLLSAGSSNQDILIGEAKFVTLKNTIVVNGGISPLGVQNSPVSSTTTTSTTTTSTTSTSTSTTTTISTTLTTTTSLSTTSSETTTTTSLQTTPEPRTTSRTPNNSTTNPITPITTAKTTIQSTKETQTTTERSRLMSKPENPTSISTEILTTTSLEQPEIPFGHDLVEGEDGSLTEYDETGVPLGTWRIVQDEWIFEEYAPLGSPKLPKTGDVTSQWTYLGILTALLCAGSAILLLRSKHGKTRR